MKNFTLVFLMLIASVSFAQNAPINFEPGGQGAAWTWAVFENTTNPPLQIIPNPDASGINSSATVAKFTALQAGNPWAGCESMHGADIGPFVLGANNSIIKIMVWKSVISDVGIKLVAPTGWAQPEKKVANTLVNQWEELTFDFSSYPNPPASEGAYDQIVVFPDFNLSGRTQDNIVYFDNITFNQQGGGGGTEPMTAAPTPTRDPANVISLFSGAYTDVPVDTWRTPWSAAVLDDITIQGNPTKKYSQLDFVGIETVANPLNVTGMTHFHIDVWSADFTFLGVKLVDFGADGAFGGGDDVEHQVNFNAPAQGQWLSLDIPLSEFAGLTTREHLAQYILVGQPSGANTVYVDNVYFFTGSVVATEPLTAAPTPTRNPANVISLFSGPYTDVPVDTWRTPWSAAVLDDITIQGNPTKKYSQLDFVGIETVANPLDITEMTHFHIDVWSANFTFFGVKLVDFGADGAFGGGDDVEHQVNFNTPAQSQWVGLDIQMSEFAGLTTREHLAQYILVGQPSGANTVYVDNVYFFKDTGTSTNNPGSGQDHIKVFPNPVQFGEQVQLSAVAAQVEVFDLTGKRILSLQNTSVIPTAGMNKGGVYAVTVRLPDGAIQTKKLVVE